MHGEVLPDPRELDGLTFDLAAQEHGGVAEAASDRYFSSPHNLNAPGRATVMGEGWETSRRRDSGNDWVQVHLAGQGVVAAAEIDTSYFIGNAPGAARLRGRDGDGEWFDLLDTIELRPDTRHRVLLHSDRPVTEARLDIYPDGGLARLRLFGRLTADGLRGVNERWQASA